MQDVDLATSTDRLDAKRRETFHLRYANRLIAHAHVNRHYRISMLPEDEEVVDDYFVCSFECSQPWREFLLFLPSLSRVNRRFFEGLECEFSYID